MKWLALALAVAALVVATVALTLEVTRPTHHHRAPAQGGADFGTSAPGFGTSAPGFGTAPGLGTP